MKNTLLAIALATAGLAAIPLTSHAADNNSGFFINGNVGDSNLSKGLYDDDDTGFGANGHFNLTPNWYLSGRAGFFRADVKGGFVDPINGTVVRVDDNANKWYAGAGFGYDFSNNFGIGLNYDYYKADKNNLDLNADLISVSAEYRF
jgi:OOP family OmpA-OmpF porin/outer membrane immunogenic protein